MKFKKTFEKKLDTTLNICSALSCLLLLMVTLSVCAEVILRYFFNRPQVWVIELSEYALLYITFMGAAWVHRSNGHVKVDLLSSRLPEKPAAVCRFLSSVVISIVSLVLVVFGFKSTWVHFRDGIYNSTILEVPMSVLLIAIPLGGLLLFFQAARQFTNRVE